MADMSPGRHRRAPWCHTATDDSTAASSRSLVASERLPDDFCATQRRTYETHRLEWPKATYCPHPRTMGLISSMNPLSGPERWRRKMGLSLRKSVVRALGRGVRRGIPRPERLRMRRRHLCLIACPACCFLRSQFSTIHGIGTLLYLGRRDYG